MFSGTGQDVDETVERRDGKKEKDKGYVAFYSDDDDVGVQGDDESLAASTSIIRFVIMWFGEIRAYEITFKYWSQAKD